MQAQVFQLTEELCNIKDLQLPTLKREKETLEMRLDILLQERSESLNMSQQTSSELEGEVFRLKNELAIKQAEADHFKSQTAKVESSKQA